MNGYGHQRRDTRCRPELIRGFPDGGCNWFAGLAAVLTIGDAEVAEDPLERFGLPHVLGARTSSRRFDRRTPAPGFGAAGPFPTVHGNARINDPRHHPFGQGLGKLFRIGTARTYRGSRHWGPPVWKWSGEGSAPDQLEGKLKHNRPGLDKRATHLCWLGQRASFREWGAAGAPSFFLPQNRDRHAPAHAGPSCDAR
jgi:hypothetical protein